MDIKIHTSTLPHDDPNASLGFWRDALGFEVRNDVGEGKMCWIRVGPPASPTHPSSSRRRSPIPALRTTRHHPEDRRLAG